MYPLPQKVNIEDKAHFNYVPELNIQITVEEREPQIILHHTTGRSFYQFTGRVNYNEVQDFEDPFLSELIPREYVFPIVLMDRIIKRKEARMELKLKKIQARLDRRNK